MKSIRYTFTLLIAFFAFLTGAAAQVGDGAATTGVDMADAFRGDGKIYVVVAVLLVILIGIFIYLIRLDRKVTAVEKQMEEGNFKS